MNLWSISFAYRLGLGFHALNNEGADGSNLMQPRRIDVGKITYDGISGEIIRRHILEHFINICREQRIPMLPLSEALHPDRGQLGIRQVAKQAGINKLTKTNPQDLYKAVRTAVANCAVLDIGGYLAAFSGREGGVSEAKGQEGVAEVAPSTGKKKFVTIAPEAALMANMAELGGKTDGGPPYTVKRDSAFDVAWLISEEPQDLAITQHAAYRPSGQQSLYSQTMRSNVYGGVIRVDLHRIGTDDYWYLHAKENGKDDIDRLAITPAEQRDRQVALIEAITNFIASPTGAKVAGWAPHIFLTEGAILLTSSRTAPFASPIKVSLGDKDKPIQADPGFSKAMRNLAANDTWVWTFNNVQELLSNAKEAVNKIREAQNAKAQT